VLSHELYIVPAARRRVLGLLVVHADRASHRDGFVQPALRSTVTHIRALRGVSTVSRTHLDIGVRMTIMHDCDGQRVPTGRRALPALS